MRHDEEERAGAFVPLADQRWDELIRSPEEEVLAGKRIEEEVLLNLAVNARDAMPAGDELSFRATARTSARTSPRTSAASLDETASAHGGPVADETSSSPPPEGTQSSRGTETILLVEDEDALRSIVRLMLHRAGYQVLDAGRGSEALRHASEHAGPIHLLLTDVVMPEMNGPELVERMARLRPAAKVLYMSGYTDHAALRRHVLEADVEFLEKPFTMAALTAKVRVVLDAGANP